MTRMKMIDGELVPLTADELAAEAPVNAAANKAARERAANQARARAALVATDCWIVKATETGDPVSTERLAYRAALREIASGASDEPLPERPA